MFLLIVAVLLVIYGTVKNDPMFLGLGLAFAIAGYFCPGTDKILGGALLKHPGKYDLRKLEEGQTVIADGRLYKTVTPKSFMRDGQYLECSDAQCSDGHMVNQWGERVSAPNQGRRIAAAAPSSESLGELRAKNEGDVIAGEYSGIYHSKGEIAGEAAATVANKVKEQGAAAAAFAYKEGSHAAQSAYAAAQAAHAAHQNRQN